MNMLRNLSRTCVPALCTVVAILSGVLTSHATMAQEEKTVENFPTVLQRNITLWSDGTRLSGVLLYPKDRKEDEKLPSAHIGGYYVACLGRWGGHNPPVEFLMIWLSQ